MKLFASGTAFFTLLGFLACSSTDPVVAPPRDAAIDSAIPVDDSTQIPCAPREVLQTVCQQCHARTPLNGAPFPLVTRTDILTMRSGGIARDLMIAQLVAKRMPLAPVTIEDEQRATLLAWLQDGAVAVTSQSCLDAGADAAGDPPADASAAADSADAADADDGDTGTD